ncbi:MAG: transglycosylase SLT domain-containing protein [Burkholderiaceae bacterium]|nr:transglycosylase SLT domain-containing protein [Burkholderiaceae bacterium]
MPSQRQVGALFDLCVRAVGADRFSMVAIPLTVLLVAAALPLRDDGRVVAADTLSGVDAPANGAGVFANAFGPKFALQALSLPWEASASHAANAGGVASLPEGSQRALRSPLKLTPEQQKVAQFVAKKYRIAVGDVQHLVAYAYGAAREFRLDPYLVLAVMSIESSFNPNARSPAGAQGLMQVLTRVHADKFAPFGGATAAFDPVANISVGSRILKEYLVREGSVEGALKSYVGAALQAHDSGYGYKVLSERERIAAAAAGRPIPVLPPKPPAVAGDEGAEVAATPALAVPGENRAIVPAALRPPERPASSIERPHDTAPDGGARDAAPAQPGGAQMFDALFDAPPAAPAAGEPLAHASSEFATL